MTKIKGTKHDDDLIGGLNNDLISGMAGNDRLHGNQGDDRLDGGNGNDVLIGGAGNDRLIGGRGADEYEHSGTSEDGDDVVKTGDNSRDKIVFTTPDLFDFDFEREGNDLIVGILNEETGEFDGTVRIINHYAGSSIAFVQADFADFNLDYGTNADLSTIYFTPNLKNGLNNTDSSEILIGTNAGDIINGNGGYFDFLTGGGGNDIVHGGHGFDNVRGGDGNDKLFGDAGNDVVRGDRGDDFLDGGAGTDLVRYDGSAVTSGVLVDLDAGIAKDLDGADANAGTDTIVNFENVRASAFGDEVIGNQSDNFVDGGGGNDLAKGGSGNDALFGRAGDDTLDGEADNDSLDGGDGSDTLSGAGGFDFLVGGDGSDTLLGGEDGDFLAGGAGDDFLDGGAGSDEFEFNLNEAGTDTMTGFEGANDFLSFTGVGDQNSDSVIDLADLLVLDPDVFDDSTDVTVTFTTGASLIFAGVGNGSITQLTQLVEGEGQISVS